MVSKNASLAILVFLKSNARVPFLSEVGHGGMCRLLGKLFCWRVADQFLI
jgi:hypothetical protein